MRRTGQVHGDERQDLVHGQEQRSDGKCGVGIVFEVAGVSRGQGASRVHFAEQELVVSCLVPGSSAECSGVIQVYFVEKSCLKYN